YGRIVWLHDWSSAWVGFEMDGSLVVRCGVPDVGGGQASSLGQIAAEVLGVDFDRVSLHISDSALTPLAGTTTASRQLYMSGNAVLKAARELRAQILSVAASLLGADPAEVEVDTETGAVRVLKYAAAHDVGRAINPQSVEGQIQGGAVQGLGYGLMEEVVVEEGVNLTTSFASYLDPSAADVPDVDPIVVESGEGLGPFGARG